MTLERGVIIPFANLQGRAYADLPSGLTGDIACIIDAPAGLRPGQTISAGSSSTAYVVCFLNGAWTVMGFAPAAWTTYTPAIDSSAGTTGTAAATVSGRYAQIDKIVHFKADVAWTNAGSWTGNTQFTLPVTAQADGSSGFITFAGRDHTNLFSLSVENISSTKIRILKYDGTSLAVASGQRYIVQGTYEAS